MQTTDLLIIKQKSRKVHKKIFFPLHNFATVKFLKTFRKK